METKKLLGHIALQTSQFAESLSFYQLLGAKIVQTDTLIKNEHTVRVALLAWGDFFMELIEYSPSGNIPSDEKFAHLCIQVADLDQYVEMLRSLSINAFLTDHIVESKLFGGIRYINLIGPSGEKLELQELPQ